MRETWGIKQLSFLHARHPTLAILVLAPLVLAILVLALVLAILVLAIFQTMDQLQWLTMQKLFITIVVFTNCVASTLICADEAGQLEFFESKIRPVLVEHCYRCHSSEAGKSKGGLLLDSRTGWQTGGDSGPAIIPYKPQESLVLLAINQSGESSEMPPDGRLSKAVVQDL